MVPVPQSDLPANPLLMPGAWVGPRTDAAHFPGLIRTDPGGRSAVWVASSWADPCAVAYGSSRDALVALHAAAAWAERPACSPGGAGGAGGAPSASFARALHVCIDGVAIAASNVGEHHLRHARALSRAARLHHAHGSSYRTRSKRL